MRVVVTGGRNYEDYARLKWQLDILHLDEEPITEIHNGGMRGADALSSWWAYERQVDTYCWGAQWGKHGKSAGPKRNIAMLDGARPDVVVACPGGRGTAHTVSEARKRGIRVVEVP